MKPKNLRDFQEEDILPRNDLMTFRCNRKLSTFVKGYAAVSKADPSQVLRFAVQQWAESEGYNPVGLF